MSLLKGTFCLWFLFSNDTFGRIKSSKKDAMWQPTHSAEPSSMYVSANSGSKLLAALRNWNAEAYWCTCVCACVRVCAYVCVYVVGTRCQPWSKTTHVHSHSSETTCDNTTCMHSRMHEPHMHAFTQTTNVKHPPPHYLQMREPQIEHCFPFKRIQISGVLQTCNCSDHLCNTMGGLSWCVHLLIHIPLVWQLAFKEPFNSGKQLNIRSLNKRHSASRPGFHNADKNERENYLQPCATTGVTMK